MVDAMLVAQGAGNAGTSGFDAGPLSWVHAEIGEALAKSLEALEAFAAAPDDGTTLKHARTHVHQAAGAIQMVGLDAVVAFTDEIERQLARLEEIPAAAVAGACAPIDRACRKLRIFLDELVNGAIPVPLKLFPEYEAMQKARGQRAAAPADLFFPDMSAHAPRPHAPSVPAKDMPSLLIKQRRLFQRGLLAWLRGHDDGARQMRDAIAGIEEATSQASLRAFWWSAGALLDALIERGLDASFGVKQLAARIDLQIRRLAEGSAKVADRLRREVLYYVAISAPVAPSVDSVQRAFDLPGLIPSAEVLNADVVGIQPHLRDAREQLASAKDSWLKYTSGRAENLPKLKQTLSAVHRQAAEVGNGALMKLTAALVARLDRLSGGSIAEPVAMEYATALLLADTAFQNFANLSPEFPKHVEVMLARLDAAQASRPFDDGAAAPVLEEMSRRAQERMLLAQVGREIQANLRHMEQVLDGFFRDHANRGELASLVKDSAQVRGALRMLELSTAEALLASCEEQIASYTDTATPVIDEDLELLAESLSGLGFYIEAVEQQRFDHERLIAPLLAKRRGEEIAPVPEKSDSVEAAVEELRNALPQLIAEVHQAPSDLQARDSLRSKLAVLRDDAELIGDSELAGKAKAALLELEDGGAAGVAVSAIAETAAPPPAPEVSQETQRLLETEDHALDAELLDIFLSEAAEVLDTIGEQVRILAHNPADREALRTARRQFHTLKGSGRMVGLNELAEIAYDVEKMHNRLLEEERTVTPAVLGLIRVGEEEFRAWVAQLRTQTHLQPDPTRVHDAIRAAEAELPRGRESVLKAREAALAAPSAPAHHATADAAAVAAVSVAAPALAAGESKIGQAAADPAEVAELSDAEALASVLAAYRNVDAELGPQTMLVQADAQPVATGPAAAAFDASAGDARARGPELDPPDPLAFDDVGSVPSAANVVEEFAAYDEASESGSHSELPPLDFDLIGTPGPESTSAVVHSEPASDLPELADVAPASHSVVDRTPSPESQEERIADVAITTIDLELPDPHALPVEAPSAAPPIELAGALPDTPGAEHITEVDEAIAPQHTTPGDDAGALEDMDAAEHAAPVKDAEAHEDTAVLDDLDDTMRDTIASVEEIVAAAPPTFPPHLTLVLGGSEAQARPPQVQEPTPADEGTSERGEAVERTDEITIGEVTLSRSLYEILVAEAEEHLATLSHELALLQFDPSSELSAAIVRASHTLCGIHRAGGFALVPATAKALEQCLLAMQQRGAPISEASHAVIARAVDLLTVLVSRVRDQQAFTQEDAQEADGAQADLDLLRQEVQASASEAAEHHAAEIGGVDEAPSMGTGQEIAPSTEPSPEAASIASQFADEPSTMAPEQARAQAPSIDAVVPHAPDVEEVSGDASCPDEALLHGHEGEEPVDGDDREEIDLAAATPAPINTETPLDQITDEVDEQLLPIFLEEAEELFPQAGEQLRLWRRSPQDGQHPSGLRRTLHTFKGSARMAGAMRLGELAHRMESRLLRGEEFAEASPELFEALDADLDRVAFVLDALRDGRSNVALPWLDAAIPSAPQPAPAAAELSVDQPHETESSGVVVPMPGITPLRVEADAPAAGAVAESEAGQRAMLRVRADVIDRLVNEAGEVTIARGRIEGELRTLKANLLELTNNVIRMRAQVREIEIQAESQIQSHLSLRQEAHAEFDPLEFDRFTRFQELTRSLAEGINDVSTVQQALLRNVDDADAALLAQSRLSREMQQQLFSIRTVPFGSLSERLYRIMRQMAKELDKRANLDIRGSQVELDRSVLEKLVGPLEHLLRNALDHGIESREARTVAGKPPTGEIVVTVRQVGNEIAIELADDGAGIDLERIRARGVAQGRIAPDAQPTEAQLIQFIFEPGFSTASRVTHVSGRGIGMDVVRSEIGALGGRVEVSTRPGRGTTFLLYLPLTLAVAQAVLVRAGGRLWALPAPMVEQVQQVKAENLVELYASRRLRWQGRSYSFHYLPRLLGDSEHSPVTGRFNPVLLLRTGQGVTAVHVDEMIGNQEVVVKNIGPQLARISGIAGATVLGSGEIVLIINPVQLAQRPDIPDFDPLAEERVRSSREAESTLRLPLAMVVDDSLTVRKITGRLLAREGFDVVTAKDGIEALQRLEERRPDVILLDIEMPRMDGFEFTKTIKADARHATIPIIMITSRTAEKHRNRARELGVDLYLGKPYQEQDLLRTLREMLSVPA